MPYLTAHFADQRSAVAAMDQVIGRGLGRARVIPLLDGASEPNGEPTLPADLGEARVEIELAAATSDSEVRALLLPLGATAIVVSDEPAENVAPAAETPPSTQDDDVARAIRASERGATDTGEASFDPQTERSEINRQTKHDPHY